MPRIKTIPSYGITHSIIINKYKTNELNVDEIKVVDHRKNKFSRNPQILTMKNEYTSDGKRIKHRLSSCTERFESATFVENSLDSRQYYLRSKFSSTELGMISKSLSKCIDIKSNQSANLAATIKKEFSTETFRKNENVTEGPDKSKKSGEHSLISKSDNELACEINSGAQKQIKKVVLPGPSANSEHFKEEEIGPTDEDKINEGNCIDVCQEQNLIENGKISSDCLHNNNEIKLASKIKYPSREKNQDQSLTAAFENVGRIFAIPAKNVNKRQKLDLVSDGKSRVKPGAKPMLKVISSVNISAIDQSIKKAIRKNDMHTGGNSESDVCDERQHGMSSNEDNYTRTSKRILEKNMKSYKTV